MRPVGRWPGDGGTTTLPVAPRRAVPVRILRLALLLPRLLACGHLPL